MSVQIEGNLEIALELDAPLARLVGKARQVVEVDRAGDAALVQHVAAEGSHFILAVAEDVADAHAAFGQWRTGELGGLVLGLTHGPAGRPNSIRAIAQPVSGYRGSVRAVPCAPEWPERGVPNLLRITAARGRGGREAPT